MLFLASPNNPTGTLLPLEDAERLCKVCYFELFMSFVDSVEIYGESSFTHHFQELPNTLVVIDEAYVEFCDASVLPLFGTYDNLIICRTMSKW